MLVAHMARSAEDSFESANRLLNDEAQGSKSSKKLQPGERSEFAAQQSNRAKESGEAHSHQLRISKRVAHDAAENLAVGRERQRKRDAVKHKPAAPKKNTA